ncbi:uncharacterized protein EHS24_000656 [Apiotrichum porosum]|uniref:Uncharacterized protein n=1 Tax=Apiotrichum porosum TaxID=105984 RepID=A0A427YAE8_9TREE|nr:uncharacterized protein EHS24_000654 [Apiotrichum porosum]XP_028480337.1 uncharacterized protein EHS24_000656 [Apiotrichum porosum]RSH88127.1 hypothetical protein EHS24_000654 [Apiotrichum porosum]RSH88129.1 hypothetical protein EHS24_000656 [Apiotrichum porosum]
MLSYSAASFSSEDLKKLAEQPIHPNPTSLFSADHGSLGLGYKTLAPDSDPAWEANEDEGVDDEYVGHPTSRVPPTLPASGDAQWVHNYILWWWFSTSRTTHRPSAKTYLEERDQAYPHREAENSVARSRHLDVLCQADPSKYRQDDRGGPPINLDAEIKVGRALKTLLLTPAQAATYLELERNDTRADREPEPSHPRWWMMTNRFRKT